MGIKQDAAARIAAQAVDAVVQAALESKVPPEAVARMLIGKARRMVGDETMKEMLGDGNGGTKGI